jgi:hypothetical protein
VAIGDEPIKWRFGIEEYFSFDMQRGRLKQPGGDSQLRPVLRTVEDVGAAAATKATLGECR